MNGVHLGLSSSYLTPHIASSSDLPLFYFYPNFFLISKKTLNI